MNQLIYFFKNRVLYYGIAALMAVISVHIHYVIFFLLFILYVVWLKTWRQLPIYTLIGTSCLFSIFFIRAEWDNLHSHTILSPISTSFSIIFTESPVIDGDKWSAIGKETTSNEKLAVSYKLKTEEEKLFFQDQKMIGKTCNITGVLEKPAIATNENGFDYEQYLRGKSIYWQLEAGQFPIQNCSEKQSNVITKLKTIRQTGSEWIEQHFSNETKALAIALIFGDRQWIEHDVQTAYQKLGIIHLLAISGSHIIVIVGLSYFLLIRFGVTKENAITILLCILPVYAVLTGLSPSVIRAVLMSMLILVKRKWRMLSSLSAVDIISVVFLLYLFYEPKVLFNVGFLLTFTVCVFLLLSSSMLLQASSHPLKTMIFTTFISEFSVLPIILYYFYELPTLSLLANMIFIPFYSIIVLPYFLAVFVISFLLPAIVPVLLMPIDLLIKISDQIVMALSRLPFSTIIFGKPPPFILMLMIMILPLFFFLYEKKPIRRQRLYILPFMLLLIHYIGNFYNPYGEVTFIDIGQGDSILIKEPFHKGVYLIDTGGTIEWDKEDWQIKNNPYEVGKDVVVPFLKSKGISSIDKLILTHGDLDHIGGSLAVLKSIHVKEIVLPFTWAELSKEEKEITALARKKRIAVTYVKSGQLWKNGNDSFSILSPIDKETENKNDGCIVIKGRIGGLDWLFTGDLEEEGEKKLLQKYPMLTTDILKVGHHGSKTSTSSLFLNTIHPKAAIISVGKINRYGHPHKEVLERLQEKKITIWRTDKNGAITYKFFKNEGTFYFAIP
ncbi:DNA internalization-related competence protein ComEC/Rec2 [Niallia sp. 01092]|uniref:DNA internalization-related competence protein ComEC/Rec2 n=1 Tax=unclassified Niallia TaxID=2837522 RepID=UPI003FD24843